MTDIFVIPKKPVKWGVWPLQCLTCLHEWVLVAPVDTELECNKCGDNHLKVLGDNRLCSPPEQIEIDHN